jgi:hypothetical protein
MSTTVGVFCGSTKLDDILMWSHYADSHRGICIEFDGTLSLMAHAQKVQYARERVPINPYEDSHEVMMGKALLTKSEQWSYECEWRLIRYKGGPGVVQFRPANLTGIIIGALASPSTVDTVMTWVRQRSIPVSLYQSFVSPKKFDCNSPPCELPKILRAFPPIHERICDARRLNIRLQNMRMAGNGSESCRNKLAKAAVRLGYPAQCQVSIALRTLTDQSVIGSNGRGD